MNVAENKGPVLGMRHVQCFLLFFDIVAVYVSRLNIGVAVVAMTNAATTNPDFPEFDWNERQVSYILSSFYWGYFVTQIPGGALCKRFGAKKLLGLSTFASAVLSAITPWCVSWGSWQAFCAIRLLQGLSQGVVFPSVYQHLAKWSPLKERNRMGAFSHTGLECGTVLAMGLSGIIAEGPMGWPGISYISAGISFVWCILWLFLGADNACETKFITEAEKIYIESSLEHEENFHQKKIPIPWKAVLCSVPFYALLIARCAHLYGVTTLQGQLPSYMHGILNLEIKSNALYSALPFLASWAVSYVYLFLSDVLQRKELLSLTSIRRVFNSFAFWIPAACLIGIGFLNEDNKVAALSLMTVAVAANSGNIIGCCLNIIDLSPNHAGFLMSIINTAASLTSLIAPLVVGIIVTDFHNRSMWQIVFGIAAAIFFFGNLIYICLGTAVTQPWDADDFLDTKEKEGFHLVKEKQRKLSDAEY